MDEIPKSTLSELLSLWTIQESLLQQYRTIFITMQSIFIAVGSSILSAKSPWIPMLLLTILGFLTIWLWHTICATRGECVFFTQYLILCAEQGEIIYEPLKRLKLFQSNVSAPERRDIRFTSLRGGKTRWKMERLLPMIFVCSWFFIWMILTLQFYEIGIVPRSL